METQGPPLMLGKPLSMTDQFLMNLLNSPERLDDCWVVTDPAQPDNPIIFASPGFCAMSGYEAAETVGRNCRFLQGEGTERRKVSKSTTRRNAKTKLQCPSPTTAKTERLSTTSFSSRTCTQQIAL
jgi:PAS domain-containing protein